MAGKRNIQLTKGDDYSHVITITNDAGVVDITGRIYSAQVRKIASQPNPPDATFTYVLTNPTQGEVTIYLSDAATDALDPGTYRWDLQENASGVITTLLAGRLTVIQDVTR